VTITHLPRLPSLPIPSLHPSVLLNRTAAQFITRRYTEKGWWMSSDVCGLIAIGVVTEEEAAGAGDSGGFLSPSRGGLRKIVVIVPPASPRDP
jgi:hypothetical protein